MRRKRLARLKRYRPLRSGSRAVQDVGGRRRRPALVLQDSGVLVRYRPWCARQFIAVRGVRQVWNTHAIARRLWLGWRVQLERVVRRVFGGDPVLFFHLAAESLQVGKVTAN